jgi:hypothetical protein
MTTVTFKRQMPSGDTPSRRDFLEAQDNTQAALNALATAVGFTRVTNKPSSSSATGTAWQYYADSTGLYLCVSQNSWIKLAGGTF